jgi:hypothetical protein
MTLRQDTVFKVHRVQAKYAVHVFLRRQAFRLVVEQISAAKVQFLARHQVAELPKVHEAPNHRVRCWLLLAVIILNRHQRPPTATTLSKPAQDSESQWRAGTSWSSMAQSFHARRYSRFAVESLEHAIPAPTLAQLFRRHRPLGLHGSDLSVFS